MVTKYQKIKTLSVYDGIGRHASFRHSCPKGRAGSTPAMRTYYGDMVELDYTADLSPAALEHEGSTPSITTYLPGDSIEIK